MKIILQTGNKPNITHISNGGWSSSYGIQNSHDKPICRLKCASGNWLSFTHHANLFLCTEIAQTFPIEAGAAVMESKTVTRNTFVGLNVHLAIGSVLCTMQTSPSVTPMQALESQFATYKKLVKAVHLLFLSIFSVCSLSFS